MAVREDGRVELEGRGGGTGDYLQSKWCDAAVLSGKRQPRTRLISCALLNFSPVCAPAYAPVSSDPRQDTSRRARESKIRIFEVCGGATTTVATAVVALVAHPESASRSGRIGVYTIRRR